MLTDVAKTVKVAKVDPCGIVTVAGMSTAAEDLERVMIAPPDGAAAVNCTVPVPDWPLVMVFGDTEMLLRAAGTGFTVRVAVAVTPA